MTKYRRYYHQGAYMFFTLVTHDRQPLFNREDIRRRLRQGFARVSKRHPFKTQAIVLLPDHLHCIWKLPDKEANFSLRWRLIKHYVSVGFSEHNIKIWQHKFWDHVLRNEEDWKRHMDYIHYNPVKHGYVQIVKEWPYSTFHRFVKAGLYDQNWGKMNPDTISGMDLD